MTKSELGKYRADRAVGFIQSLKHVTGEWARTPFILDRWQEKIIRKIFGTLNGNRVRQIQTVYLELPRKNGKTALGSTIANFLLFADDPPEYGAEIYSVAGDKEQASLVFNSAMNMVNLDDGLKGACEIVKSQKRIIRADRNSFYRVISSDADNKHGFNVHGCLADELHVWPGQRGQNLWDVLQTSRGTRRQPLTVAITTAGFDRNSLCWKLHDYAKKVQNGVVEDPTFYGKIFAADEEDDWMDESVWYKANPALGKHLPIEFLRSEFIKAKEIPAYENTFKRLYLNLWTRSEVRWLPLEKWDLCNMGPVTEERLIGKHCYGGLDLAQVYDLTAFVLAFPPQEGLEHTTLLPYFFVPNEGMQIRARRDGVPYDMWARAGLIKATPGDATDFSYVFDAIDKAAMKFDLKRIAFDRWGSTQIVQRIQDRGMEVVPLGQGFKDMNPPTKGLMSMVLQKEINHGGNPVLRWNADNMVVSEDPAANLKPNKDKSTDKIDGMVASIMAVDCVMKALDRPSVYESRGVRVI